MELTNGAVGIVSQVDPQLMRAKVKWPTTDTESPWLFVATINGFYNMPELGDQAICFYDRHRQTGIIIGIVYADEDVPYSDDDLMAIKFPGLEIRIAKGTGKVEVISQNEVTVKSTKVTIDADEVSVTKKLTVGGEAQFNDAVKASKTIDATGVIKSMADVQTATLKLSTHMHPTAATGPPSPPIPGP